MKTIYAALLLTILLTTAGCEKDDQPFNSCEKLSTGLVSDDPQDVRLAVNQAITELPSAEYLEVNLEKLAEKLSTECSITTVVLCYSCIHTVPAKSELGVSFTDAGVLKEKVIEIAQTDDNKMAFSSVHD